MTTIPQPDNQSSTLPPFEPSSALDVDQDRTLEHRERATPVRLIGTFHKLVTTHIDELFTVSLIPSFPSGHKRIRWL
jgi:hypothetical protein